MYFRFFSCHKWFKLKKNKRKYKIIIIQAHILADISLLLTYSIVIGLSPVCQSKKQKRGVQKWQNGFRIYKQCHHDVVCPPKITKKQIFQQYNVLHSIYLSHNFRSSPFTNPYKKQSLITTCLY